MECNGMRPSHLPISVLGISEREVLVQGVDRHQVRQVGRFVHQVVLPQDDKGHV